MERWDTIDEFDRSVILNASWPTDRGVFWVTDDTPGARYAMAFVLDDCVGDAVESMAYNNDHEGDEDEITVRRATVDERAEVVRRVRAWLATL